MPYAIQNVIPVLFNMPVKNYFIATLLGNTPPMFVTVSIGSGIEEIIDIIFNNNPNHDITDRFRR